MNEERKHEIIEARECGECSSTVRYGDDCACGYDVLVTGGDVFCAICEKKLSAEDGWFAWFIKADDQIVDDCAACCHGRCADQMDRRHTLRGRVAADNHLDRFVGPLAFPQFARLMLEYEWLRPAKIKCIEYFLRFRSMPPAQATQQLPGRH